MHCSGIWCGWIDGRLKKQMDYPYLLDKWKSLPFEQLMDYLLTPFPNRTKIILSDIVMSI